MTQNLLSALADRLAGSIADLGLAMLSAVLFTPRSAAQRKGSDPAGLSPWHLRRADHHVLLAADPAGSILGPIWQRWAHV
jgi:hypothetical protein